MTSCVLNASEHFSVLGFVFRAAMSLFTLKSIERISSYA
jgi:hypothetical protein